MAAFTVLKQESQKVLDVLKATGLENSNDPFGPRARTLVARYLGVATNDPGVDKMIQRIQFVKANAMRALTGARMSQYVAQQMEPHLPDSTQSGKKVKEVLENLMEQATEKQRAIYDTAGIPLPGFVEQRTPEVTVGGF